MQMVLKGWSRLRSSPVLSFTSFLFEFCFGSIPGDFVSVLFQVTNGHCAGRILSWKDPGPQDPPGEFSQSLKAFVLGPVEFVRGWLNFLQVPTVPVQIVLPALCQYYAGSENSVGLSLACTVLCCIETLELKYCPIVTYFCLLPMPLIWNT